MSTSIQVVAASSPAVSADTHAAQGVLIRQLAVAIWEHSHRVSFGGAEAWDLELFKATWARKREKAEGRGPWSTWAGYREGWYWFLVDGTFSDHSKIARPDSLPLNGCDIGVVSRENLRVFGEQLLCSAEVNGRTVVYNGHERRVKTRVRAHFSLSNQGTGALGLRHFQLQRSSWELRVFAAPCLEDLPEEARARVSVLMSSKSGRESIESAWRAVYGWPLLCKQ